MIKDVIKKTGISLMAAITMFTSSSSTILDVITVQAEGEETSETTT